MLAWSVVAALVLIQPSSGAGEPSVSADTPASADAAVPDAEAEDEPAVTEETAAADPPVADPEPEPAPSASAQASAGADDLPPPASSRRSASPDDEEPDDKTVIRPRDGHWGMQFTFGGLAPMSIAGLADFTVNRLLFSEIGVRRALRNGWAIPFSVGVGVFNHNPETGDTENDVGLSAAIGFRKSFRVWRRIAPYVGADLRVSYVDPDGPSNWLVGVGFGPNLGIEYFFAHRVSLLLQGDFSANFNIFDGLVQARLATQISGGGQMGLVFYF